MKCLNAYFTTILRDRNYFYAHMRTGVHAMLHINTTILGYCFVIYKKGRQHFGCQVGPIQSKILYTPLSVKTSGILLVWGRCAGWKIYRILAAHFSGTNL